MYVESHYILVSAWTKHYFDGSWILPFIYYHQSSSLVHPVFAYKVILYTFWKLELSSLCSIVWTSEAWPPLGLVWWQASCWPLGWEARKWSYARTAAPTLAWAPCPRESATTKSTSPNRDKSTRTSATRLAIWGYKRFYVYAC